MTPHEVVYGQAGSGGRDLALSLLAGEPGERRTGVLLLHGGGWRAGDRAAMLPIADDLARRGHVAASASYRLVDEAPWPAPLEDTKCAVRWMRTHAADIGVDPDRIVIAGGSAGGHLAALVALTPGRWEGDGGWHDVSSAVWAAALYNPVLDLRTDTGGPAAAAAAAHMLFGTVEPRPAAVTDASPITHITRSAPPILTRVGDADEIAPAERCRAFHALLDTANVANTLEILPGAGHGLPVTDPAGCAAATATFLASLAG